MFDSSMVNEPSGFEPLSSSVCLTVCSYWILLLNTKYITFENLRYTYFKRNGLVSVIICSGSLDIKEVI